MKDQVSTVSKEQEYGARCGGACFSAIRRDLAWSTGDREGDVTRCLRSKKTKEDGL
jgi:hypothetical protein